MLLVSGRLWGWVLLAPKAKGFDDSVSDDSVFDDDLDEEEFRESFEAKAGGFWCLPDDECYGERLVVEIKAKGF